MMDRLSDAFAHERRLVANASHELGTPIANQRIVLEVALDDEDASAARLRQACSTALAEAVRAQTLLQGMLAMARAEQADLATAPVRVDDVVRPALAVVAPAGLRLDDDLRAVTITADEFLLERLVANLVGNAVAHNVPGGWVRAELDEVDGTAELRITNSAESIDPATADLLVEPFRRGAVGRTGPRHGNGLGLAIADAICSAHGWGLQVAAAGDTFEVTVRLG